MIPVSGVERTHAALLRRFRARPISSTFTTSILFLLGCLLAIFLSASDGVARDDAFQSIGDADGIFFLGHVYRTDLDARTVTISWLIGGCGSYMIAGSETYRPTSHCGAPNLPIDVYIDSSPTASFKYDPTLHPKQANGRLIFVQFLNQFSTTHTVQSHGVLGFVWARSQDFYYPFDTYETATAFVAVNPLNTSAPPPILRLNVVDAADSFIPATDEADATGPQGTTVRVATVRLARTEMARAFTLVLFLVNWALALAVVYLTIVAAVARAHAPEGLLLVPLTVVLTIPALRALFVDAPRFGMLLDILGLFMQMALVSLCSIVATLRIARA
ncbi:hypothetical protein DFH09DRAFT_1380408 [Mycena vulgaris]|nr:hypothetical protein DFH09DRAFT_1380408 [Mycena vulgaris]